MASSLVLGDERFKISAAGKLGLELVVVVDHRLEFLGVAFHGQDDRPLLDTVGTGGDRGDDLPRIRQAEADGERSVGAELDRLTLQRDLALGSVVP